MVTIENYEEYLMMAADGELDAKGMAALNAFLEAHPEHASEADAWALLKMQPDTAITYDEKKDLLRPEPKRIALGWCIPPAVAAAVALILVLISRQPRKDVPHFVHRLPGEVSVPVVQPVRDSSSLVASVSIAGGQKHNAGLRVQAVKQQEVRRPGELAALSASPAQISQPAVPSPMLHTRQMVAVNTLSAGGQSADGNEHQPFIQLAASNEPALELLKAGVEERISQVSNAVKSIRETAFAVRIGNKNHYLNY